MELNPEQVKTGKKSFKGVATFIHRRVSQLPPDFIISYWHKAVLCLFEYLVFVRL